MKTDLIKEIDELAKGTGTAARRELWEEMKTLKIANRNMYLYSESRLRELVGAEKSLLEAKENEKASAKEAEDEAYKAFISTNERYLAMAAKWKEAKTDEERDALKKEAVRLNEELRKEFNAKKAA